MKKNYFFFIPVLVLVISVLKLISDPVLGITPDSFDYIKISSSLPIISNSIFPIFYPVIIKLVYLFTYDYFISTKLICLISVLFAFYYPYRNNFFWKELWIICAFPAFLSIYYYSWSETILLPLLIIFAHINYDYFENEKNRHFFVKNLLLLVLLLLTKYSMIGLIVGYLAACIMISIVLKKFYKKPIYSVIIASFVFVFYLMINYYFTGYLMGERFAPIKEKMRIRYSLFNIIYNLNPFVNDRILFDFKINYILLAIFTFILYLPLLKAILNMKRNSNSGFLMMSCGISFLLFTIISYFTTKLDTLDSRLLMPFILFFLLGVVIFLHKNQLFVHLKKIKYILLLGIYLSLILNLSHSAYKLIKHPVENKQILTEIKNITS